MDVSVVIPVYNVEPYLQECLNSVLSQTGVDIEVICVNDGSTDGSGEVLKRVVEGDPRVSVITQENQGQGAARNRALDVATGRYVYFMDSDDVLAVGALAKLVALAEREKLDHIIFGAESFLDERYGKVGRKLLLDTENYYRVKDSSVYNVICDGAALFARLVESGSFYVSPPLRLLKRDIIERNQLRFLDGMIHEDNHFTPLALIASKRAVVISDKLYRRRLRCGSTMSEQDADVKHAAACFSIATRLKNDFGQGKVGSAALEAAIGHYLGFLFELGWHYLSRSNSIDRIAALKEELRKTSTINQQIDISRIALPLLESVDIANARAQKYRDKRLSSRLKRLFGRKARKDARTMEESNKAIKVSVIVPVYNAERHLRQALDSLCAQTLKDVEFICVDDGSSDGSGAILDEYAARDGRFRVFHTVNQGAANARNFGMAQACGEYLAFMDADDYVESVWLEEVYGISCKNKLDMCIFDFQMFSADTGEKLELWWTLKNHARKIVFNKVVSPGSVKMWPLSGLVTQGFYKRSFVVRHVLFFQNIQVSEDALFVYEAMLRAKRVLFLANVYYWYRRGHSSSIVAKMAGDYSNQIEYISRIANSYWKTWSIFRWRTYRTCLRRILYDVMYYGEKDRVVSKWLNHEGWKRLKASKFSRRKLGKDLWSRYKRLLSNKEI